MEEALRLAGSLLVPVSLSEMRRPVRVRTGDTRPHCELSAALCYRSRSKPGWRTWIRPALISRRRAASL